MESVLRWAGSKRKLLKDLRRLAPARFVRYFEPFAGSAVLFFDLLPPQAVLGDLNPEVVATLEAIRDNPEEVCRYLYSVPLTREAYYKMRGLVPETLSHPQRAARLIYLMKACFNGVYRTNRDGQFNVPLGSRFFALPGSEVIYAAAAALKHVEIIHGDFATSLKDAGDGDFVYLDPPYSDGNRFRGEYSYQGAFGSADQLRLLQMCSDLCAKGARVLLSFKDSAEMINALDDWTVMRINVTRSVAGFGRSRREAREILAWNY